jgi:branched-chain amino acid transport system permease protein
MIVIFIYAGVATGWNILGGYAGQVSLGHAVYFGIGAYASTVAATKWGITPWIGMLIGGIIAVLVSMVIGYPCFKLGGRYFSIATLVFGEVMFTLFLNWQWVGGAVGIFIPMVEESFYAMQFHASKAPYYYIGLAFLVLAVAINYLIDRSQFGYYLRAIKGDEVAAHSLGIDLTKYKMMAMAVSAFLGAIGGTLYANYIMYIDPTTVMYSTQSTLIMLVAAFGGMGSLFGPTVGALVLYPMGELTRAYLGGGGRAGNLVIYGVLVLVVALYQPGGLVAWLTRLTRKRS